MEGIRDKYALLGVDKYYQDNKDSYVNPHYSVIERLLTSEYCNIYSNTESVLDLCCGSGEVSNVLRRFGWEDVEGLDPYMYDIYERNLGNICHIQSFKDISSVGLSNEYDTIICSFALHLCPIAMLHTLCYQLALKCKKLIILSPNKRPVELWFFSKDKEVMLDRVRYREYSSLVNLRQSKDEVYKN